MARKPRTPRRVETLELEEYAPRQHCHLDELQQVLFPYVEAVIQGRFRQVFTGQLCDSYVSTHLRVGLVRVPELCFSHG